MCGQIKQGIPMAPIGLHYKTMKSSIQCGSLHYTRAIVIKQNLVYKIFNCNSVSTFNTAVRH